ncbi:MAG: plasmid replication protein RepC [Pseudomonadota bacterium]
MTHITRPNSGRANRAACPSAAMIDKWHILDTLTDAAEHFGIGHRQLAVLRALLSFHPQRHWPVTADNLIVFPSNRTLCARLAGMPDSTLRRHLAALVAAGLVSRHASANGKRYRRGRGQDAVAFGIDLAPLVTQYAAINAAATTARQDAEDRAAERARVLSLRAQLRPMSQAATMLDDLSRALRRKLSLAQLRDWATRLRACLADLVTAKSSTSNSQNERHKEPETKKINHQLINDITPRHVDDLCNERRSYFDEPLRSWSDVERAADNLAPMMGLSRETVQRAADRAGRTRAAIAVLIVLERFAQIRDPGGYLMSLVHDPGALAAVLTAQRQKIVS